MTVCMAFHALEVDNIGENMLGELETTALTNQDLAEVVDYAAALRSGSRTSGTP